MPDTPYPIPVVILVHPQLPENIGASARAMSNFGLTELRLVAPRDGWPHARAREVAAGAEAIIDAAKLYPNFPAAIADVRIAYATTARPRGMEKRVLEPGEAMAEIESSAKTALVFGPERTGLENDHVVLCDACITIPTAENSSLNLAQSVAVLGYEWWCAYRHPERSEGSLQRKDPSTRLRLAQDDNPAAKADWTEMFAQLEAYLDEINYFRTAGKKPLMWQNLRNMLMRGAWSEQEIRTFRGMLRELAEGRKRR